MAHWKLQLPIGSPGKVDEISPAALTSGYTSAYFYGGAGPAMVFWAPVTGVTTGGSTNPRSELRQLDAAGHGADWTIADDGGVHTLAATVQVLQVPSSGRIIISQVFDNGVNPMLKIEYESGTVVATLRATPTATSSATYVLGRGLGLGTTFQYQISVRADRTLTIDFNGRPTNLTIDPSFATASFYFKAGDYVQDNQGPQTEGGRVAFFALTAASG